MTIQPSIEKRALSHGISMVVVPSGVEARKGKQVLAFNSSAKGALSKALERLEEDRLRNLRDDQEPTLNITGAVRVGILAPAPVAEDKTSKGSIIKAKYKDKYKKNGDFSCGDDIADELRAYICVVERGHMKVSLVRLKEVAVKNEVWKDSYEGLNPGQQRMTIGNRLRARHANGEVVDIGGAILQQEFKDI